MVPIDSDSVRLLRITLKAIVAPEPLVAADRRWYPLRAGLYNMSKNAVPRGGA